MTVQALLKSRTVPPWNSSVAQFSPTTEYVHYSGCCLLPCFLPHPNKISKHSVSPVSFVRQSNPWNLLVLIMRWDCRAVLSACHALPSASSLPSRNYCQISISQAQLAALPYYTVSSTFSYSKSSVAHDHFLRAPVVFKAFLLASYSCVGTQPTEVRVLPEHPCEHSYTHAWSTFYTWLCAVYQGPGSSWPGPHQVYSLHCQGNFSGQDQETSPGIFSLDITPQLSVTSKPFF